MEAATLTTVLLVSVYRTAASLEAAWKYFILCGVGIAQALFGSDRNIWRHVHPDGVVLPNQGWKVHVSATVLNAGEVLRKSYEYLIARRVPFKYLRTQSIVLARNSKYAPREGSGKLITIYPADDAELESTLVELSEILKGFSGAYTLRGPFAQSCSTSRRSCTARARSTAS